LPDGGFYVKEKKMVVILKDGTSESNLVDIVEYLDAYNVSVSVTKGEHTTILGLVGDTTSVDQDALLSFPFVDDVKRIQEPYKAANKKFHPEPTVIDVNGLKIGGGNFQVIAGPCSVESEEQIVEVAKSVKASGASMMRGGAFKPRTSPYAFQGLRAEGIELLLKAKEATGMPIVTEIMSAAHLPLFEHVDVIQVGARNMQNFELLKVLGKQDKPILLKRGLANTIEEWLMSAEYIMAGGNKNIILCERGIRTFETATRNTLDLSAIPVLKEKTHLPVIVDPSHATGVVQYVEPLSVAAVAAGADGLIIEVHNNPAKALCDGPQSLTPAQFDNTMKKIKKIRRFMETEMN
jgi:3-deoxy-7-phosphoheptulonate synthase